MKNYGFLKRSREIPDMFWADVFLCLWVGTGVIGGIILFLICLTGCAGQPMVPYQSEIIANGFQTVGAQIASGGAAPQFVPQPYQPIYSPVFNPVPITSANPYAIRR